jgi:predicted AAA+ superfamily ATPase
MPEAVQVYLEEQSFAKARLIQTNIDNDYIADMTKHAGTSNSAKIHAIWRTLPVQLAKENTKFQYSAIEQNARSRNYSDALEWLQAAGIITVCTQISEGLSPLTAFENPSSFKVYYEDTGLLAAFYDATLLDITDKGPKTARFRGGMVENYVMQQLAAHDMPAYYWGVETKAEVDFVIQDKNKNVIPIEVKSGRNVSSASLKTFMRKYSPPYAIRLSTNNFGFENAIKSIPLYAAWCIASPDALPSLDI